MCAELACRRFPTDNTDRALYGTVDDVHEVAAYRKRFGQKWLSNTRRETPAAKISDGSFALDHRGDRVLLDQSSMSFMKYWPPAEAMQVS